MPTPTALTPELAATIRGARLVGTPLRACVKAAGVPWQTAMDWLRKGRLYNSAAPSERNAKHAALGSFAADLDRAGAQATAALHARVMKATDTDGRLALDVLQWNEERGTRDLKRQLVAAQVEVETLRANGMLPPSQVNVTHDARDELVSRFARLAQSAEVDAAHQPPDPSGS